RRPRRPRALSRRRRPRRTRPYLPRGGGEGRVRRAELYCRRRIVLGPRAPARHPRDARRAARGEGVIMSASIRPLHPLFVGEVAGIDCRRPLDPDEVAAIEAGMDRYAVLVFRDPRLTDEAQLAFTRHFGELEAYQTPGHIRRRAAQRLGPGMADFSNLDKDGNIIAADDRVWFFKLADRL